MGEQYGGRRVESSLVARCRWLVVRIHERRATSYLQPEHPMSEHPAVSGEWRDLAIVSWRVAPELLRPRLPAGTELDEWDGRCWLSLVGLRFLHLAVGGVPVPLHGEFAQVNLRFYARRVVDDEVRRGAVFVRELVPRAAMAAVARLVTNEPMAHADVRADVVCDAERPSRVSSAAYEWDSAPGRGRLRVDTVGEPVALERLSLEEFLAERCWGFTAQRDGGSVEYRVEHPRWSVYGARAAAVDGDLAATFPLDLARVMLAPPDHAFVAEGSRVAIHAPRPIG
jgi:uncharacterized protein